MDMAHEPSRIPDIHDLALVSPSSNVSRISFSGNSNVRKNLALLMIGLQSIVCYLQYTIGVENVLGCERLHFFGWARTKAEA